MAGNILVSCGFGKDRATADMIFTARQLQEKNKEQNVDIILDVCRPHQNFGHSRDGLWKIMAKFGCPPRFIAMVWQFNDGMQACVQNDGDIRVNVKIRQILNAGKK